MLRYIAQQTRPNTFIPELAKETGVSERNLWRDWTTRSEWMTELLALDREDQGRQLADLLNIIRETRSLLFHTHADALRNGNDAAAVGALGKILETVSQEADLRIRVGLLRAEPERLEAEHTVTVKMWRPDDDPGDTLQPPRGAAPHPR